MLSAPGAYLQSQETGEPLIAKDKEKAEPGEAFDPRTFIMDHIADSHEWHILTKKNEESVAIYLPVILYSREKGLDIFSSKKLAYYKLLPKFIGIQ